MSNDIKHILERLAAVEGRLSPAQQKVPQLPALFKPKHIRVLGSKTDPADPMDGYMVGERRGTALEEAMAEIEEDMVSRVKKDLTQYLDHLEKKGRVNNELKNKALDAIERGEVEETGAMALGGKALGKALPVVGAGLQAQDTINRANLGDTPGAMIAGTGMVPVLSIPSMAVQAARDKYKTGSWFPDDGEITKSVQQNTTTPANQRPTGPATKQPWDHAPMQENAPVRTYTMENGKTLECWGDEQNGFEIRHEGRSLPTRFPNVEHADIAVRLFQNRRPADPNQDYVEEK